MDRLRNGVLATAAALGALATAGCPQYGAQAPVEAPPAFAVVDLHVDLAHAAVTGRPFHEGPASGDLLRRGGVVTVVVPLFVDGADAMAPVDALRGYDAAQWAYRKAMEGTSLTPPERVPLAGQITTVFALEGADGFAEQPEQIDRWIERGVCLVGLVHQRTNKLAGSSQDPSAARREVGLTDAGDALVRRVFDDQALVDVAHASDAAFDAIARIALEKKAPLVDSHTGVRALVAIDRNLDDARLRVIAQSGGVVGIDLHSGHVSPVPGEAATMEDVANHVEHAVRVAGIDHVAIGSDLEGGIVPPSDSNGEASWPELASILRRRGWADAQIAAIFAENARRVLRSRGPCARVR